MTKDLLLGRTEQKIRRNATRQQVYDPYQQDTDRARQTRKRHKQASKARSSSITDLSFIFKERGVPDPSELVATINSLIDRVRNGRTAEDQFAARIFDPELKQLTDLPIGLLCHKEETLPAELLPQGRSELQRLCRRMIIRSEDQYLIELVLAGWPGPGSREQKLERHVSSLLRLSEVDAGLYQSLLCGQHGEVILALRQGRIPAGFTREDLIHLLVCHGLLWCTNDIQLILARNALAERNPFEALISSDYVKLEPTRVVNDLRPYWTLLKVLLEMHVTTSEEDPDHEVPTEGPDHPIYNTLEASLRHHSDRTGVDLKVFRTALDETIPYLREHLKRGGRRLRLELEKPVTSNELEKSFHAIWFTGLTNVQASAIPIMRYLQAEAELEREIRTRVPQRGDKIEPRQGVALPAFSADQLAGKWRERAKDLLDAYRQALLQDADNSARAEGEARSKNAGWQAIEAAMVFLVDRGERLIPHHAGNENCPKRTYYLLDIIPEHRLALQRGMTHLINGTKAIVAKI